MESTDWLSSSWESLTRDQLYGILQLRNQVFVVEQDCPYQDCDDLDAQSHHMWTENVAGKPVAYARVVLPGFRFPEPSIGRVVTCQSVRRGGWGRKLMAVAIEYCETHCPDSGIRISAQCYLRGFYESLGFEQSGEEYLEDNIPHIEMFRGLNKSTK